MPSWTINGNISGNLSGFSSTSQSFSSGFSNIGSSNNGQMNSTHTTQSIHTDSDGNTTMYRSHQSSGQPRVEESRSYDRQGRQLMTGEVEEAPEKRIEGGEGESAGGFTVQDVTDEQSDSDKRYEEAMEDEYAKREGGA